MKEGCNPLLYKCYEPEIRDAMLKEYSDSIIKSHLEDLYHLIQYQLLEIQKQRQEIIAYKHKKAWENLDKPISEYNPVTRKYFTEEELRARKC